MLDAFPLLCCVQRSPCGKGSCFHRMIPLGVLAEAMNRDVLMQFHLRPDPSSDQILHEFPSLEICKDFCSSLFVLQKCSGRAVLS